MKNIIIIVIIIIVGYIIYVNFIAPPEKKAAKKVEEKVFEEPYSQTKAAKQAEAKQYAQLLMNKEEEYFAINGRYASSLSELKFVPRIGRRYKAKVISADESNFRIEIRGNIDNDPTEDIWEVDKDGFRHLVDDVTR
ncbi:hypothetical protein DRQ26_00300 [bacterium]|nr:MAG: hypothetical protein DRQ26_00300 [bacterium]